MATEIRVPTLGESVTEATIGRWFKKPGEPVKADEPLVELETDKVTLEGNAPAAAPAAPAKAAPTPTPAKAEASSAAKPAPAAKSAAAKDSGPAVARIAKERGVDPAAVPGTGRDGRVTKGDMLAAIASGAPAASAPAPTPVQMRAPSSPDDASREERVRMTKLRQTIARR